MISVYFDGVDDGLERVPLRAVVSNDNSERKPVERKLIQLRDYQLAATESALTELEWYRSALIVLATGLGKTILFAKLIEQWEGRVLVLAHLEELLQNARDELRAITGEPVGTERGKETHEGERIVVGLIQSVSRRLKRFRRDHFSLIIIDEAHHAASDAYRELLDYFETARVVGLTATDSRADGRALPFESCSYRMGIREGIDQGYLVPVRGRRVFIESFDLTRIKRTDGGSGDFDEADLDNELVKNTHAIADVMVADYPFDKAILFFPGCASARLTAELLNEREPGSAVYVDGTITGDERRKLIDKLRNGESRFLCNVGIATEGFNWPEASVIAMCAPTLSKPAYVQRAGRGTRPLAGLLNGLSTSADRKAAIAASNKPSMLILDFVGNSANLDLISADNFLEEAPSLSSKEEEPELPKEEPTLDEMIDRIEEQAFKDRSDMTLRAIAKNTQSKTVHSYDEFDPFEATGEDPGGVGFGGTDIGKEPGISYGQYKTLKKYGIADESLTRKEAQKLIGFVAENGWRLWAPQIGVLKKLHRQLLEERRLATS